MTSSNGNISALLALCAGNSPVTGEFPSQRPVTRSFDVFFNLRLNKQLSKQSWGWWVETPSRSLWRNCNVYGITFVWNNMLLTGRFAIVTNFVKSQHVHLQTTLVYITEAIWGNPYSECKHGFHDKTLLLNAANLLRHLGPFSTYVWERSRPIHLWSLLSLAEIFHSIDRERTRAPIVTQALWVQCDPFVY